MIYIYIATVNNDLYIIHFMASQMFFVMMEPL